MFQIDPLELLKSLREKDEDDFQDMAFVLSEYIVEQHGPDEVLRAINDLILQPPIKAPYLSLVVNK